MQVSQAKDSTANDVKARENDIDLDQQVAQKSPIVTVQNPEAKEKNLSRRE